jgi:hypothetical protein
MSATWAGKAEARPPMSAIDADLNGLLARFPVSQDDVARAWSATRSSAAGDLVDSSASNEVGGHESNTNAGPSQIELLVQRLQKARRSWLVPNASRRDVEASLAAAPEGTFMVRKSETILMHWALHVKVTTSAGARGGVGQARGRGKSIRVWPIRELDGEKFGQVAGFQPTRCACMRALIRVGLHC